MESMMRDVLNRYPVQADTLPPKYEDLQAAEMPPPHYSSCVQISETTPDTKGEHGKC